MKLKHFFFLESCSNLQNNIENYGNIFGLTIDYRVPNFPDQAYKGAIRYRKSCD